MVILISHTFLTNLFHINMEMRDYAEEIYDAFKAILHREKESKRLSTAGIMTKGLSKAAGREFLSDVGCNLSRHVAEYAGLISPKTPKSPKSPESKRARHR